MEKIIYGREIANIVFMIENQREEEAREKVLALQELGIFPYQIEYDINRGLVTRKYNRMMVEEEEIQEKKEQIQKQYMHILSDYKKVLLQLQNILLKKRLFEIRTEIQVMEEAKKCPYGRLDNPFQDTFVSIYRLHEIVDLYNAIEKDTLDKNKILLDYRLKNLIYRYEQGKDNTIFSVCNSITKKNSL